SLKLVRYFGLSFPDAIVFLYWVAALDLLLLHALISDVYVEPVPGGDSVDPNWLRQSALIDQLQKLRFADAQVSGGTSTPYSAGRIRQMVLHFINRHGETPQRLQG